MIPEEEVRMRRYYPNEVQEMQREERKRQCLRNLYPASVLEDPDGHHLKHLVESGDVWEVDQFLDVISLSGSPTTNLLHPHEMDAIWKKAMESKLRKVVDCLVRVDHHQYRWLKRTLIRALENDDDIVMDLLYDPLVELEEDLIEDFLLENFHRLSCRTVRIVSYLVSRNFNFDYVHIAILSVPALHYLINVGGVNLKNIQESADDAEIDIADHAVLQPARDDLVERLAYLASQGIHPKGISILTSATELQRPEVVEYIYLNYVRKNVDGFRNFFTLRDDVYHYLLEKASHYLQRDYARLRKYVVVNRFLLSRVIYHPQSAFMKRNAEEFHRESDA